MQTIARNYRKNPHKAAFLMAFHAGTNGLPSDLEVTVDEDLLDSVPEAPADLRTPGQIDIMRKLLGELAGLDHETAEKAAAWTTGMTVSGQWVPRSGNARTDPSLWISAMIAKVKELRMAQRVQPVAPTTTEIPAGRYAVTTDEIRCYSVDYGKPGTRWDGFTFLNRISSDDRFPIRNAAEKARILAAIAADVDASAVLAALTLRACRRCGRTLSDTKNPYFTMGLGPDCGSK